MRSFRNGDLSFSSIPLTRPQLAFGTRGRKSGEMIFIRGISGAAGVWRRGGKKSGSKGARFCFSAQVASSTRRATVTRKAPIGRRSTKGPEEMAF